MPKAHILIVEDDWIVAEDTKITLKKLGFDVSGIVTSGEESLKKVEAEPPDLVLMDIKLEGEMDGIEAAERIRGRFNIPVVYVTGYADEDVLERVKVTEPFGYMIKPFEDRELNSVIEISLYKHKMETKLKESERRIQISNDELEQRVKERTAELQGSNEELADEIEERLRSEEALRLERDNFTNIMNAMDDGAYIVNKEYEIEYLNQKLKDQFGETGGRNCFEYFHDRQGICPWCRNPEVFEGKTVRWNWYSPKNQRTYDLIDTPLENMDGTVSKLGIFRDVTDLKHLQAQLVCSERLAATGQLAASIAHEINSPLQAITILLDMSKEQLKGDSQQLENLEVISGAFETIKDTAKSLLDLNRPGKEKKEQTDVNGVIENTVVLLKSHLRHAKVRINLDMSLKIPDIMVSSQGLSHCLLNLVNNAVEAMSGASKSGRPGGMTGGEIKIRTLPGKENIVITVADTGPGIAEKDLHHVFDAFYTRKKKMGMGVGLSICHGFVEDHGGTIAAENSPEGGGVFTIKLPLGIVDG